MSIRQPIKARFYATLLPIYILAFAVFLLAPIAVVVIVSFSSSSMMSFPLGELSLRWYWRILEYKPFIDSLMTSLFVAFLSAIFAIILSIPAALGLARSNTRFSSLVISFLLSPLAIPPLVIGLSLLFFLSKLGLGVSLAALLISHTIVSIPYVMRTVLAVYSNVGANYGEAAAVLGAGPYKAFYYVTLPLIAPGIFAGALFSILVSLDNLGVSYFFGTGQVTTLPVVMLSYLQNQFDPAIAAISTVQMVITIALLLIVERIYGLKALTTQ